jgi:hypothetical protein
MAQIAIGNLVLSDGSHIPLGPLSIADASDTAEVTTDSTFTLQAQSIGDYAQGKTILQGFVSAKTHAGWAYILRNGLVAALIPVCSRTAGGSGSIGDLPLCAPFTLRAGDKLIFHVEA